MPIFRRSTAPYPSRWKSEKSFRLKKAAALRGRRARRRKLTGLRPQCAFPKKLVYIHCRQRARTLLGVVRRAKTGAFREACRRVGSRNPFHIKKDALKSAPLKNFAQGSLFAFVKTDFPGVWNHCPLAPVTLSMSALSPCRPISSTRQCRPIFVW